MIKCDPRAKAICPFKNPCCGDETAYFVEGSECDEFNQKILAPPPTNADRIRAMTDEELAEKISRSSILELCDIVCDGDCKAVATFNKTSQQRCAEIVLNWLRQPAEENKNGV